MMAGVLMLPGLALTVTFGLLAVPLVRKFKISTVMIADCR